MILGSICNSFGIYTLLVARNRAQIEGGELLLVIPDIALWRSLTTLAFLLDAAWLAAAAKAAGPLPGGCPSCVMTAWPPPWSSSAARAHAVMVSVLTPAEILIAARRLGGA